MGLLVYGKNRLKVVRFPQTDDINACHGRLDPVIRPAPPPRDVGGGLDGAYEFVSQRSTLTKPISIDDKDTISTPKWRGLWVFKNGYFSSVLMQTQRPNFLAAEDPELGYESYAGSFTVKGDRLTLFQSLALSPILVGRPVVLQFRQQGNSLVLTQELRESIEDVQRRRN